MICSRCNAEIPTGNVYCLQCGASINEPPPTVRWDAPPVNTGATNRITAEQSQPKSGPRIWLLLVYILGGALGVFGGLVLYNTYQAKNNNQETKQSAQEVSQNNNSLKAPDVAPTATPQSSATPAQKPSPSPTSSPSTTANSAGEEIWYVMLGGYRDENRGKADERLRDFKQRGYNAYIVDTNDYENFDPGLHAIVMGPYTKSEAERTANQMRPLQPDVYVKWARPYGD